VALAPIRLTFPRRRSRIGQGRSGRWPGRGRAISISDGQAVDKPLFFISCTTCQARLAVRNEAAVGVILACPKCGSMVQVVAPPGWKAEGEPSGPPLAKPAAGGAPVGEPPAVDPHAKDPSPKADTQRPSRAKTANHEPTKRVADGPPEPVKAAHVVPPPLPQSVPAATDPKAQPGPGPTTEWASPSELLWRRWLLLVGGSVAVSVVVVGVWSGLFAGRRSEDPSPAETSQERPSSVETLPLGADPWLDSRWLPERTRLLVSLRLSELAGGSGFDRLSEVAAPFWEPIAGEVLRAFSLAPGAVGRLSWASTQLADWPGHSVVVVRLREGNGTDVFRTAGEPLDFSVSGAQCRRLTDSTWGHPFAVVDRRTIVTGQAELLRRLADRSDPPVQERPMDRLIESLTADADLSVAVDLTAARNSGWRLPTGLLDVWPAGRQAWRVLWEVPEGLGLSLRLADSLGGQLALACRDQTAAEKVRRALDGLVPAAGGALAAGAQSLAEKVQSGRITAAVSDQYELLLKQGQFALQAARWEVADETVWVRIDWGQDLAELTIAGLGSRPAIRGDWLAAALAADESRYRRLLAGLDAYRQTEGHFPAGAIGGRLLPAETRLSWIAAMLPHYGHADWHRQLHFGYSWNDRRNRPITQQPLEEVVNPALGPSRSEAGFPVTHYVGIAGVGADAGLLTTDDPRAGVFGFGRTTAHADIADGAANTIAVLGVAQRLGSWAAGGNSTVRALTKRPYVNGPDGFGSGQAGGMLAGMADGSVRFISKDIDPKVLEQLATIHGQEAVTVAALDQQPTIIPEADRQQPQPGPPQKPAPPAAKSGPKPERPPIAKDRRKARQAGPVESDTAARLAERIAAIDFRDQPLAEVVAFLADLSGLRISFDREAIGGLGVDLDEPVTVRLSDVTVGEVLTAALAGRPLVYVVEGDRVVVTTRQK